MQWRYPVIFVLFVLLVVSLSFSQTPILKQVPVKQVSASDGRLMYQAYCASCHGMDGRGGPAAAALKRAPTDLSQLARANRGRYPSLHVQQSILSCEHSQEMPQWRPLFYSLSTGDNMIEATARARAVNLARFVESLQR